MNLTRFQQFNRTAGTLFLVVSVMTAGLSGCRSNRFKNIGQTKENSNETKSVDFRPGEGLARSDDPVNSGPALRSSVSFDDSWKRAANFSMAEGIVQEAYKVKEVAAGYDLMKKGEYEEALSEYRRAQTRLGSNPFVSARIRHTELLVQSADAEKNRALSKALEIVDEDGRASEAKGMAEEAISLNPRNLFVRKDAYRIIYETSRASEPVKAREAKLKMIDAARMIQDIESQSEGFLFNFREDR